MNRTERGHSMPVQNGPDEAGSLETLGPTQLHLAVRPDTILLMPLEASPDPWWSLSSFQGHPVHPGGGPNASSQESCLLMTPGHRALFLRKTLPYGFSESGSE